MGVHHVGKIISACNSIFQEIDQQNDIGNDAYIEFIVDRAATGCCIAAQIKSGPSYVRNGQFIIPTDEQHIEYWRSHTLPICGIVYDPQTDVARWVDITKYVSNEGTLRSHTIQVPQENVLDKHHFSAFQEHFLGYRARFSDSAHFGASLADFSHQDNLSRCRNAIRALFSFHRNRIETWYFLISSLTNFRGHPLLRFLVAALTHVPGHMDIFWGSDNIISEPVRKDAEALLSRMLSRDLVLTLVSAIEPDGGIGRGTIGQCVHAIVALSVNRRQILESIVRDVSVADELRYWSLILLVAYEQLRDVNFAISVIDEVLPTFSNSDGDLERLQWLRETLSTHRFVDFA